MTVLQEIRQMLPPVAVDIIRLTIWLFLLMAIFVPLERLFAENRRTPLRKGLPTDLCYYFINNLVPKALLVFPMAVLGWGLHRVVPGSFQAQMAALPLWARLLAALVVGEFGFYWGHRWTHEIPFLWRFHSVHHGAEQIDWLVNTHAHPVDIVFVRLCGFVPMYALGLAQPLAGNRVDVVPLLIMMVALVWGFFLHANLSWRLGWLEWLVATPHFHHWHHTKTEHVNRNYASMLPLFDKIFGTMYLPKKDWPASYGIQGPMASGFLGQLMHPFFPPEEQPPVPHAISTATSAQTSVPS
jgi:sterol desaturase/sphingolipid hydroxylase (fatty acid hydroxylase superfamily)